MLLLLSASGWAGEFLVLYFYFFLLVTPFNLFCIEKKLN